jgi:hypothetical protein
MAGSKSAILDGYPRSRIGPPQLDHVIPVADIGILDQDIRATQVDPIGVGRRPGRSNAHSPDINIGPSPQKLNMEFGRIFDRDTHQGDSLPLGKVDHGRGSIIGIPIVEIRPPSGPLTVHGAAAVDGDVGQPRTVNEARVLGEGAESGHAKDRPRGQLEGHVAFEGDGAAQERAGGD